MEHTTGRVVRTLVRRGKERRVTQKRRTMARGEQLPARGLLRHTNRGTRRSV